MNDDPLLVEAQEAIDNNELFSEEETESQRPVDMAAVVDLSDTLVQLENEVTEAEEALSALKNKRKTIAEEHLPAMLETMGIDGLSLSNGKQIVLNEFVDARIKDSEVAFDWLRATNNDSIIKNQVNITLGRDQDDLAQEIKDLIEESFSVVADRKVTIHHATLKSFCRDALDNPELAESLPREAFGIYQGKRVKVT
jgi:hypothetical protein